MAQVRDRPGPRTSVHIPQIGEAQADKRMAASSFPLRRRPNFTHRTRHGRTRRRGYAQQRFAGPQAQDLQHGCRAGTDGGRGGLHDLRGLHRDDVEPGQLDRGRHGLHRRQRRRHRQAVRRARAESGRRSGRSLHPGHVLGLARVGGEALPRRRHERQPVQPHGRARRQQPHLARLGHELHGLQRREHGVQQHARPVPDHVRGGCRRQGRRRRVDQRHSRSTTASRSPWSTTRRRTLTPRRSTQAPTVTRGRPATTKGKFAHPPPWARQPEPMAALRGQRTP